MPLTRQSLGIESMTKNDGKEKNTDITGLQFSTMANGQEEEE
jgi:hypothetical protein